MLSRHAPPAPRRAHSSSLRDGPDSPDRGLRDRLVTASAYGVVALCALAAVLLVLRATGVISWSWWRVLAPVWIPVGALSTMLVLVLVAGALADLAAGLRSARRRHLRRL